MTYKPKNHFFCSLLVVCLLISSGFAGNNVSEDQWQDPFQSTGLVMIAQSDSLSLSQVLGMVGKSNPSLRAGLKRIEAAKGLLTQAGLWSNPELEIELEEVGWDAPGFRESEMTVMISQELELWGTRKNRKQVAQRELEAVNLESKIGAFDIYTTTKERYSILSHAQRRVTLAQDAVDLATDIAESARIRVNMGASMKSELLLGQLEIETAALELVEAISELEIAKTELTSLWQGEASDIVVAETNFDSSVVTKIEAAQLLLKGSREVRSLEAEEARTEAELDLERSEAKPSFSLSGGYKRIKADGSNSFVFGVGFPLPFLNRNQGSIRSLEARRDALRLYREQALLTARTEFESSKRRITQQVSRYRIINAQILPKAEEAYLSLKSAYDKGKLPYSTLLEAQRRLLGLRFELNDIGLTVKQEIVTLERLLGVTIP